jgi:putative transposase
VPALLYRNAMYQRSQGWQRHWDNPPEVGAPGKRQRGVNDSILLTKELFRWRGEGQIELGTVKHPVGVLDFHQHRDCQEPNSVTISHDTDGRWWLSFNFEDGVVATKPEDVLLGLTTKTNAEVAKAIKGHDLGVVQTVACSDGSSYALSDRKLVKLLRWKKRIKRCQQQLARQKDKKSKRRAKTKRKLARLYSRGADVRLDHAHQLSHRAVEHTPAVILGFENLNVRGMTRRPKVQQDEDGTHLPNGAAAKAALNAAILSQCWGKVVQFSKDKCARAGKLLVTVSPHFSSQACSCCGYTAAANRPTQAEFHCQACGFTANADANASAVIAKRVHALILGVLGRRTDITIAEALQRLGLVLDPQAVEAIIRSSHLAA